MERKRTKLLVLQHDYHENSHNWSDLAEQIIAAFPSDSFESVTAFLHHKPAEDCQYKTLANRAYYFDLPESSSRGLRLRAKWALIRFLKEEKFDVVICNRFKPVNLMMELSRSLDITACIGISHGFGEYDKFWRRYRFKRLLSRKWQFVGVSSAVRDYLLSLGCGFTRENTTCINNAIDISKAISIQYEKREARRLLNLPKSPRIVGAAGRLVPIKGHSYLINAFALVAEKHPDAHLAILGTGKEEENLKSLVRSLNLTERVHLPGFIAAAKRYVKAFDIWAMPSLTEGLSLSLLEGMAGQLPVIASDIPAISPFVQGHGLLVPPKDIQALAEALDQYLSLSASDLQRVGKSAFEYVLANHDIHSYREQFFCLVNEALNRTKTWPPSA